MRLKEVADCEEKSETNKQTKTQGTKPNNRNLEVCLNPDSIIVLNVSSSFATKKSEMKSPLPASGCFVVDNWTFARKPCHFR